MPELKVVQGRDKVRLAAPESKLSRRNDAVEKILMGLGRVGELFLALILLLATSLKRLRNTYHFSYRQDIPLGLSYKKAFVILL